ncbi:hypothetical protein D9611_008047 [Ephemerocybe angulata]|uniref:Uncharacterized protein n=1 Tax=Ephemerocybe angulata TaxID=980116 RepID=A0A8H5FCK3_9AGAR|nr:hypothetical protein D9611_008047 [Tulosesus angulatus]
MTQNSTAVPRARFSLDSNPDSRTVELSLTFDSPAPRNHLIPFNTLHLPSFHHNCGPYQLWPHRYTFASAHVPSHPLFVPRFLQTRTCCCESATACALEILVYQLDAFLTGKLVEPLLHSLAIHPITTTKMSAPQLPAINAIASTSTSSSKLTTNGSTTLPDSPNVTGVSGQSSVTFASEPTPPERPPRRSVKRRPPTPGGPSAVNAFKQVSRSQIEASQSTVPLPHNIHTTAPPVILPTAFRLARSSFGADSSHLTPDSTNTTTTPTSPRPRIPSKADENDAHGRRPVRPVPSRLNLAAISNHTSLSSPPNNAGNVLAPPGIARHSPTSPSHTPSNHDEPANGQAPSSSASPRQRPSVSLDDGTRKGKQSEGPGDRQSAGTSTNLDSPSTRAMMQRLLAAPDYFAARDPGQEDNSSDSSGSLRFARNEDDTEEFEAQVQKKIRQQRERSKIRKLLGADVDRSADGFSVPRRLEGFWSDPDFNKEVAAGGKRKGSAGAVPRSPSTPGIGRGLGFMGGDDFGPRSLSPRDPGYWSSAQPSPASQAPNEDYQNHSARERDHLLASTATRTSHDSRHRSAFSELHRSPPSSPHAQYALSSNRPRIHALDSLSPSLGVSFKRSKTVSGTIHAAPPSTSSELLLPPPRVSSRDALSQHRESKRKLRSRSPNIGYTATDSAAPENVATGSTSKRSGTRMRLSKSSKSLSISKSDPSPHNAAPATPSGVIVEEYKRQIIDTQNAAQASAKERRRLSALQWMIEQTKSVTRTKSSAALQSDSPPSSHKSMSPPFSKRSFSREKSAAGSPAGVSDQFLSPGRIDRGISGQPLPSPLSGVSTNESTPSLTSPDPRFGRLQFGVVRPRGEPLSPVLGSAGAQPDSPGRFSSNFTLPGSPRSEGLHSDETGISKAATGSYEHTTMLNARPSMEKPKSEKEKGGFVKGLGRKLSKKRKPEKASRMAEGAYESASSSQEPTPRTRLRGRSGGRSGGESDVTGVRSTRRGHSLDKSHALRHRKSLRLSIDKLEDDGAEPSSSAHGFGSPSVHRTTSSPGHSAWNFAASNPSGSKKEGAGGKNFWKMVKRMGSNSGLRDKYQHTSGPATPSPPHGRSTGSSPASAGLTGNQRLPRSGRASLDELPSTSLSNSAPLARTPASFSLLKHASSSADGHNPNYSHSRSQQQTISSRTSTPASSDHASSTRVFQRTHSSRSSASSFADLGIPPPLPHPPSAFLNQRAFGSRSDSGHHSDGGYRSPMVKSPRSPGLQRSASASRTPTEEDSTPIGSGPYTPPSLPAPPRRPKPAFSTNFDQEPLFDPKELESGDFDNDSPLIPTFSVDNAINSFKPKKLSADGKFAKPSDSTPPPVPSLEAFPTSSPISRSTSVPPPRPARDLRRPSPKSSPRLDQDSGSGTDATTPQQTKPKQKKGSPPADYAGYGSKPPTSAFGPSPGFTKPPPPSLPERQRTMSNPNSPQSGSRSQPASPSQHSPSRLPEISSPRALTEREKAEKWAALLEKSEKAGGTLHLTLDSSTNELDSDQLTLSSTNLLDL